MTPPDFRDLVGDEGTPEELERLRRIHELLIAAGPPPELSPRLTEPPATAAPARVASLPRRRRTAAALLAAALLALAFGLGFLLGDRGGGFDSTHAVPMHGLGAARAAAASLLLGRKDDVGNVPVLMRIRGLKPLAGGWYTLWLTKDGKAIAPCGTFSVARGGTTEVRFSVAYDLKRYDGWIIDGFLPSERRKTPVVLTT